TAVDGLPRPEMGQQLYTDTLLTGFGVLVGAKSKTYVAQRDVAGRTIRVTIGRHGVFAAERARKEAQQLIARMAAGEDPNQTKREAASRSITLRQALEAYEQTLRNKNRSVRTIEGYRLSIERYLKNWLDKPLADIDRSTVRKRHQMIGKKGKYAANATMRAFRAVWNRAMKEHEELPICPTVNVDWFEEKPRKAAVPTFELRHLHDRIMAMPNEIRRDYILFVLFTGMRRQAVATMRWEDVDLDAAMVHVPRPKGGERRAFDLPLSSHLVKLLARCKKNGAHFESQWVFPSETSGSGHIAEPKEDGLPNPHAMRHTYVTAATNAGVNPYHVKLLTNHALPKSDITGGYISSEGDDLRNSQERVTAYLLGCINPDGGDVVRLEDARTGQRR
ncbi:MAG: tyrosine-type recombinase/integrase, partial [Alphaproteobacteria bacterium]|nr:tyrosine-type recombinase/integrase [Alphaproteobacteria bacterium]